MTDITCNGCELQIELRTQIATLTAERDALKVALADSQKEAERQRKGGDFASEMWKAHEEAGKDAHAREAVLMSAVRTLVDALPRCTAKDCIQPSMRGFAYGRDCYCDEHARLTDCDRDEYGSAMDQPHAAPLRAVIAILEGAKR